MKKNFLTLFLLIFLFFIRISSVNALELDCSNYIKKGSTGENVKVLQKMLNDRINCSLKVDGIFGNLTKNCVMRFQSKNNLAVDGIVGSKTCSKLNSLNDKVSSNTSYSSSDYAIVLGNKVNVRKRATTSSSIITTVNRNEKVNIISKSGNWYKVKILNTSGYIREDLLTRDLIIVDISDQKLYFYKNGSNKFSFNVVTGMLNKHDTPIGNYVLKKNNLQRGRILRGTNDNGSKYSSYVEYWMPFIINRGIGFHDASWRSSSEFNKNQYTYDGSHGCVNMKTLDAKKLYENILNDTAVIIQN